jgi:uncharacterized protein with LGFP repeats
MTTTITERLVTGLATRWGRRKVGRRSFFAGAAVVGSALATHPVQYATRPLSALATVCGDGASCDLGWSAFCCTISGANQCPPGSFVAGWWKADRSGFCCGSARYYIDCNARCGSDWKCHCASGTCDQRRVACNQFRYGQCHREISCYGPVVCRVITCTPPWKFDSACGTTSLTDNRTATHSAPCLPGTCPSVLDRYWYDHGGPGGEFGKSLSPERAGGPGSRYHALANATLFTVPGHGVQVLRGTMLARYRALDTVHGPLGLPSGPVTSSDGITRVAFTTGAIFTTAATGAHSVYGSFHTCWRQIGGLDSGLGVPVAERETLSNNRSRLRFQHGAMYSSPSTGTHQVSGRIYTTWQELGADTGFGLPVADQRSSQGRHVGVFTGGIIAYSAGTGCWPVREPVLARWRATGGWTGPLGLPVGGVYDYGGQRRRQSFSGGGIFVTPNDGVHVLTGVYWAKWQAVKGISAGIGVPITDVLARSGWSTVKFEDGAMYSGAATGTRYIPGALYRAFVQQGGVTALGLPRTDPYPVGALLRIDFQQGSLVLDPTTGNVVKL